MGIDTNRIIKLLNENLAPKAGYSSIRGYTHNDEGNQKDIWAFNATKMLTVRNSIEPDIGDVLILRLNNNTEVIAYVFEESLEQHICDDPYCNEKGIMVYCDANVMNTRNVYKMIYINKEGNPEWKIIPYSDIEGIIRKFKSI